ncbi:hypothetical protein NIES2135_54180 [Leptolyngbya boryana NIES-2135]|jgi:uncharacterized protein (DUF427 family)|uniref:Uncharacterized protein n=1 Tax=Leptolyngbya boryana NIES-2135 TaxID=1973484 RepID=A0A1Z4JP50_LEPBY|nr:MULTISPECIES: hypothetical protein [Leptolyngbya]BAY58545.1 hypothetical protein NIES2135_54180 [Leptolyngbya boryana NIES-2135]MBD2370776.1 hypothetical protein [Leptolyngbya sp. FACHB-161]MBD2377071.1 hypothetical protein [Leptolyngbya sp. FACHB-238]MBD2401514.1 hypothetical protein [Leptolyngbya sp. FACHB-239]MBD2408066.1 hypothetical protein [Leptolyngbya sp. FACHB-402]
MPTIKPGDRVTLKRTPLYNQIPEWGDDRKIPAFHPNQIFEVIDFEKTKVTLQALDTGETRFFEWFKNAVKVLPAVSADDDPAHPCPSADISHIDLAELESTRPSEAVLANAEAIYAGLTDIPNGKPYRPSNGTEGEIFMRRWCERCEKDVNEDCSILAQSMLGEVDEWQYWGDKPLCTAWEKRTSEVIEQPTRINIHANGKISVQSEKQIVPVELPEPTGALLEFPDIAEEFKSAICQHKGIRYWIAGKFERDKKPAEMYYYIERDGKAVKSELSYCSTVFAGKWAREAIDRLVALQEVV